ncbi:hypothetical protein PIB30_030867 [Stylosanthes scabra]|uniref:Uncharacterized protein n=1 Tax=Stylosanthes scabra TaxID=79078 RepID=A0ABU6VD14_9FABA|nr:hypothetical protein [Stylosanthes scabra]
MALKIQLERLFAQIARMFSMKAVYSVGSSVVSNVNCPIHAHCAAASYFQLHRKMNWIASDLTAISVKNTNPNAEKEKTVIILDDSEIRRRASVVATIFWKLWNHINFRKIFEGLARTPNLVLPA